MELLGFLGLLELSRRATTPKLAFLWGLGTGLIVEIFLVHWLVFTVSFYGQFGWLLSSLIVIPLYIYLGAFFGAFSFMAHVASKRRKSQPSAFWLASVWGVLELIRSRFLGGFPWLLLGHAMDPASILAQVSELGGPMLVSFLMALLGATVWRVFLEKKRGLPSLKPAWVGLAFLCLAMGFGLIKKTAPLSGGHRETLELLLVQGNISQGMKFEESKKFSIIATYTELPLLALKDAINPPKLIVWPETALPFFFGPDTLAREYFFQRTFPLPAPLITGTLDAVMEMGSKTSRYRNRVVALDRHGRVQGTYDKVHLVPFGEYAPLPFIGRLVGEVGNFTPGKAVHPLKIGDLKVGTLVCYEAIFPEIARKMVNQGARILLNLSNDAWFGKTSAPYQHLRIASFLATSYRLPLVRVTNSGISAVVLPTGKRTLTSPLFEPWTALASIPLSKPRKTLYSRIGDSWILVMALYALIGLRPLDWARLCRNGPTRAEEPYS
jgi:apolipoprotein N-acyltransferase